MAGAEVAGDVAVDGFQCGLADAHPVVDRPGTGRIEVQADERPARLRRQVGEDASERGVGEGAGLEGEVDPVGARGEEVARKRVAGREGDRVECAVEASPGVADVIGELGASVTRVVVTEMRDRTYFAELHLDTPTGNKVISARPSDAIALAVRCGAGLFASDELIDEVGQEPVPEPDDDASEIIDEFKDFIENVSPEDFAS